MPDSHKSKGLRLKKSYASVRVRKQEKTNVPAQSGRRSSLFLSLFILFRSLTDWMRPTHIREGNLLYLTNSNVNPIQKHPHRHSQKDVWPDIQEPHGPGKLTHKINHHTQSIWRRTIILCNTRKKKKTCPLNNDMVLILRCFLISVVEMWKNIYKLKKCGPKLGISYSILKKVKQLPPPHTHTKHSCR